MESRLFQTVIYQMQPVLNERIAGVTDETGTVVACTDVAKIGEVLESAARAAQSTDDVVMAQDMCFRPIAPRGKIGYLVFCSGTDEQAASNAGILSISLAQLKTFYDEKYDKVSFVRNILMDNIMAGDVHLKARTLHLNTECFRVAFLIHTLEEEFTTNEVISGLFPDKGSDFVVTINETDVVLIKEVKENVTSKELEKIAVSIVDTMNTELMANVKVGIGSVVSNIMELNRSYKDACVALEVGKVFDNEHAIISYNNLGIGRLIYQLPTKLCELFLKEVFKKGTLDLLDDETIITIQKFFENNLNVSEASRQLFVHRNTLVYRLDKILKLTGLDLRHFDDAIVFKVAMMVNRYLNSDTASI